MGINQTVTEVVENVTDAEAVDSNNIDNCPFELSKEEVLYEGRWLKTSQVHFACNDHKGVWQYSQRTTKPESSLVDGVDIVGILKKDGKKYFIFIKQYRIPMRGWCLEFPAGLIDAGETVEEAAIRELKEETGYAAKLTDIVHKTQGIQGLDPGLTDDSIQFVTIEIDGDATENLSPAQSLEASEAIEVVLVEVDNVLNYMRSIEKSIHIEAMVYSMAIGYAMANRINQ